MVSLSRRKPVTSTVQRSSGWTRVRSARSTDPLQTLAEDMRRRQRNEYVRDLLPDLESALVHHTR